MILSPYSNLNIFGGVTGMPFNQNGCNVLDDPRANMIQFGIFGLINMATSYAANYVNSRNVDTPNSNNVNYKELAEAEIDDSFDTTIETAENNLTTASEQYTIITEAQTRLKAIPAEISALESQKITKGTGENGVLTPEETKKNDAIQTEIDRLNQEKETKQGEIDKAVEAINKLNIPELGTISEFTSKSVITTYANNALKKAKADKEAAIKAKIEELKKQDEAEASQPTSKQLAKAQARADKIVAKKQKQEAKLQAKLEKQNAKEKDKNIKEYRNRFASALKVAKSGNKSLANSIINEIKDKYKNDTDYMALAAAFSKELDNSFGL